VLGTAIDVELASETAYTIANIKKAIRLGASSLIVKQGRIEPMTIIGDDDANFVWPQTLHSYLDGAAHGVLDRI